jgi:hypothetical protein
VYRENLPKKYWKTGTRSFSLLEFLHDLIITNFFGVNLLTIQCT